MTQKLPLIRVPEKLRTFCFPIAGLALLSLFLVAPYIGGLITPPWDKLAHLLFYGSICVLLSAGMWRQPVWVPFMLTCLAGAGDEVYQIILPGRSAGLDDFAFDVLGAMMATLGARRFMAI